MPYNTLSNHFSTIHISFFTVFTFIRGKHKKKVVKAISLLSDNYAITHVKKHLLQ